jgi:hypothetical protein
LFSAISSALETGQYIKSTTIITVIVGTVLLIALYVI